MSPHILGHLQLDLQKVQLTTVWVGLWGVAFLEEVHHWWPRLEVRGSGAALAIVSSTSLTACLWFFKIWAPHWCSSANNSDHSISIVMEINSLPLEQEAQISPSFHPFPKLPWSWCSIRKQKVTKTDLLESLWVTGGMYPKDMPFFFLIYIFCFLVWCELFDQPCSLAMLCLPWAPKQGQSIMPWNLPNCDQNASFMF